MAYLCKMKNTRDRILEVALDLFNTEGLSQVKLRTIANKMGISQGNLNYHFKKREDIVEALYAQLVDNINTHMPEVSEEDNVLKVLLDMSDSVMLDLYAYRFILIDFVQIMRGHERIKSHFQELQLVREKQFLQFFEVLIGMGLMEKENLPNEYYNLFKRLQILGDFWISSAEINEENRSKKAIAKYREIMNQTIYPYLTEEGKKEYLMLVD